MRFNIDRIVLDGIAWDAREAARFHETFGPALAQALQGATPRADTSGLPALTLAPGATHDPAAVARQLASHIAGALTGARP